MVYLIFTQQGFEQAHADIYQNKAELWLNPDLLSDAQKQELDALAIAYFFLEEYVDVSREPDVIKALTHVEKQTNDKQIFVEFI